MTVWEILLTASFMLWLVIVLLPWRPWFTSESWDANADLNRSKTDLSDITVLIPARNEEAVIERTLSALARQGNHLKVVLIDDNSDDNTAQIARTIEGIDLKIVTNQPLKQGWSGKLWALENGRKHVNTPLTLLLDADIHIKKGVISGLKHTLESSDFSFVSLMAMPSFKGFWERLLMPAFIYFFKLLYPFRIANSPSPWVSAAAGGCILLETRILEDIGGFEALKTTLIDDCTLARKTNEAGYRTWLGLTHSVQSIRPYDELSEIWNMVARTAYTQLHYSFALLIACTALMILAYIIPVAGLFNPVSSGSWLAVAALLLMFITYIPTLIYYRLSPLWVLFMPIIGAMFLAMTWTSAIRYFKGERMRWRGRIVTK